MKQLLRAPWFWFALPLLVVSGIVLAARHAPDGAPPDDASAVFHYPLF